MSDTPIITVTRNGPYKVQNVTGITLSDGTEGEPKATMFLCRCGMSARKPFCDGAHTRENWQE
ncbi:MAG: CDGSH iron-sulfur domain-containing protein [Rhodobacteraceae bacterium]|nr:CDGSH iron-sulfur domain-containing protein [Paracoccaceae bacterium]